MRAPRAARRAAAGIAVALALWAGAASAAGLVQAGAAPSRTLPWQVLPAGWIWSPDGRCAGVGRVGIPDAALALSTGGLVLALERAAPGTAYPACALAVRTASGWRVLPLARGETVAAAVALGGGRFVVGTLEVPPGNPWRASTGRLLLGNPSGLRALPLPAGAMVQSLLALPGGGFAVGTAFAGGCAGASCAGGCRRGALGIASASGALRWYTPPPFAQPALVFGEAPGDAPCGVVVGALARGNLWFALDGVGVARFDTAAGAFRLPQPGVYYPLAAGPVQFLAATPSTVYYGVHRLPGVADAGYWGPLYAVPATGQGAARTYFPRDRSCIQGGVGAPRQLLVVGGRLWTWWPSCPLYSAPALAPALEAAAPGCALSWPSPGAGPPVLRLAGSVVAAACGPATAPRFLLFAGPSGAPLRTFGWPPSLAAQRLLPDGAASLFPGSAGGMWVLEGLRAAPARSLLMAFSAAGRLLGRWVVPASTAGTAGPSGVWLVSSTAVVRLSR